MNRCKFRLSFKAMVSECSAILLAVPFLGSVLCLGILAFHPFGFAPFGSSSSVLLIFLIGFSALIAIPSLWLMLMPIGRVLFSHLSLSNEGLDFRLWPLHRIRCSWQDVDQIKKSSLPFQGDILILKRAEVSGFHLLLDFRQGKFGVTKTQQIIPLFRLNGWPGGELENQLRKYAPSLFSTPSTESA